MWGPQIYSPVSVQECGSVLALFVFRYQSLIVCRVTLETQSLHLRLYLGCLTPVGEQCVWGKTWLRSLLIRIFMFPVYCLWLLSIWRGFSFRPLKETNTEKKPDKHSSVTHKSYKSYVIPIIHLYSLHLGDYGLLHQYWPWEAGNYTLKNKSKGSLILTSGMWIYSGFLIFSEQWTPHLWVEEKTFDEVMLGFEK